jgi:hypothetical protein
VKARLKKGKRNKKVGLLGKCHKTQKIWKSKEGSNSKPAEALFSTSLDVCKIKN